MEIHVHAAESANATQVRGYVEYRMFSAVSRFARKCARLSVRLGQDGPMRDQHSCSVVLDLAPAGQVRVRATGDRLYAAVDRAAERLAQGVERRLGAPNALRAMGDQAAADDMRRES
jgi:ribosome-associated translation inhibitor RaiA